MIWRACVWMMVATLACTAGADETPVVRQPGQPASGPGGRSYRHASIRVTTYGKGGGEYRIIEPMEPRPERAGLVVFCHGWGAVNPRIYGAWIEHIVRRGNIVIFPRYQTDLRTPQDQFTPAAIDAVKAAMKELETGDHVRADLERTAIVGHSVGGILSANLAASAKQFGLPAFKAVMSVQPGITRPIRDTWRGVPLMDLSKMPASTRMLVIVGDRDMLVGRADGERIYAEATALDGSHKRLLLMQTDLHGTPPLIADHSSPSAMKLLSGDEAMAEAETEQRVGGGPGGGSFAVNAFRMAAAASINALDWNGYWRLFDELCEQAWTGKAMKVETGMGAWSDGVEVKRLLVLEPKGK